MKFRLGNKSYQATETITRQSRRYSPKQDYLVVIDNKLCLQRLLPTCKIEQTKEIIKGKQVEIYCNSNNPQDIEIDVNNYRGKLSIVVYLFIPIGIVGLSIGIYLSRIAS